MKKINKKDIITFLGILIFACVILWQFINGHYATDTYRIEGIGYKEYATKYWLNDGRVTMAGIGLLANAINIPINVFVIALTFLGICVSSIAVFMLYNIILKYKATENKYIKRFAFNCILYNNI